MIRGNFGNRAPDSLLSIHARNLRFCKLARDEQSRRIREREKLKERVSQWERRGTFSSPCVCGSRRVASGEALFTCEITHYFNWIVNCGHCSSSFYGNGRLCWIFRFENLLWLVRYGIITFKTEILTVKKVTLVHFLKRFRNKILAEN